MARKKTAGRSDHILNSALSQFARYGFAKSTISDIAREAGVANGTIYLYYKSKDEILRACAARFHQSHKEFAQALRRSDSGPKEKLRDYLLQRFMMWEKETQGAAAGTDLAQAMVQIAPEINQAEKKLWMDTLKFILKEGEAQKRYRFRSLSGELRIFIQCLVGFFPMPGLAHPWTPTRKDLLEAIDWFDQKWSKP